jgi:glyoxylase-like metal-dependent hydrolase (beta-lactamase superfamily II)
MSHYFILLTGIPVTSERGSLGWCTVAYLHLLGRHILFDTGSYGDRSLLLKQLEKINLCPESIDTVVVSHLHFDHFVNAEIFCNATILVHKKEIEYVLSSDYIRVGDPYVPIGVVRYLENRLTPLEDGESILPGLEVMLMAGHTPGTIGLYFEPEKILFTSDSVKNAWEFVRNEPPPAFYSKDAALQNYARVREKARIVVPGHDRHFHFDSNGQIQYLNFYHATIRSFVYPNPHEVTHIIC